MEILRSKGAGTLYKDTEKQQLKTFSQSEHSSTSHSTCRYCKPNI